MRPLVLNLTCSLDGFIADPAGGFDWLLPPPDDAPADYTALIDRVDTYVMGRATYEVTLGMTGGSDSGTGGARTYVYTSRTDLPPARGVEFVSQRAEEHVAELKRQPGGAIWLFGGGRLATSLSDAGLIDEYLIVVQPILLGDGIPLWRAPHARTRLALVHAREWSGGLVELRYRPAEG